MNTQNNEEIFYKEEIRIGFYIQLKFHHHILDPIYEILKEEFSCIISSEKESIIKFKPHVIILADYDMELFRKHLPSTLIISTLHGFGTKNLWKRGIPRCDIVCLPNPWVQEQCTRLDIHPRIAMWLTGFAPADILFKKSSRNHKVNLPEEFGKDPILLYAPTWNKSLNSVDVLGNDWIDNLTKTIPNLNLIIKPHPAIPDHYPHWMERWRQAAQQNSKIFLVEEVHEDIYEYLHFTDILLTDASSVMFYYLALDRPIILVTNPKRIEDEIAFDPQGAEWQWRDLGIEIHDPKDLSDAVSRYLKEPSLHSKKRSFYRQQVFGSLECGNATKNTADKIRDFLNSNYHAGKVSLSIFSIFLSNLNARAIELEQTIKEKDAIITKQQKVFDKLSKWALELDPKAKEKDVIITKQQKEFDKLSKWALKLDPKAKEKDVIITKQQKEFDKLSKWALELDQKVKEQDSIMTKQQKEFDEHSKWALELNPNGKFLRKELDKIHNSFTWKTLRKFDSFFGKT